MSIDSDSPYQPPLDGGLPPEKGRSRNVLLALGIGCGVLLLLCCGGFAGVTWWGSAKFKESTSEDPAVIRRIASEIADVPLPDAFKPRYALNMTVPFTQMKVKGVVYSAEQNAMFMMGEFNAQMSDAERENFLQEMRKNVQIQGGNNRQKLDILESKTVDLTMRGKPASFKFAKAENTETKGKFWEVMGTFNGKEGPAMIMIAAPLDQFTEAQLKQMLEKTK